MKELKKYKSVLRYFEENLSESRNTVLLNACYTQYVNSNRLH